MFFFTTTALGLPLVPNFIALLVPTGSFAVASQRRAEILTGQLGPIGNDSLQGVALSRLWNQSPRPYARDAEGMHTSARVPSTEIIARTPRGSVCELRSLCIPLAHRYLWKCGARSSRCRCSCHSYEQRWTEIPTTRWCDWIRRHQQHGLHCEGSNALFQTRSMRPNVPGGPRASIAVVLGIRLSPRL